METKKILRHMMSGTRPMAAIIHSFFSIWPSIILGMFRISEALWISTLVKKERTFPTGQSYQYGRVIIWAAAYKANKTGLLADFQNTSKLIIVK